MKVGKFHFLADFVVVDYDVDPRVSLILRRPFLRTAQALIDVHREELILRDGNKQLIFHADNTSKHPHKHGKESINMINFIDITCEDRFPKVLKFKKFNHPSSGSTTPLSDSLPSLTPFETSDSLLKEFADELTLLDPFPPGNEDDNFDLEVELRKIEYLLNQDPSTESSPKSNIKIIDHILERFTDEPALIYSPPLGDDDDDFFLISFPELPTSKSEDTSDSDKEYDLPFCDNFVIFSNPLFDANNDFTSSNEGVPDENDIDSGDSYVARLDEPALMVTPLSDANEDECFNPGGDIDKIDDFLDIDVSTDFEDGYYDLEGDIIYLKSLLINDIIPNHLLRIAPDYEDSRARGFVHRSLKLQSLACLYMGIRYPRSY
ncbi:hypothetical protein Tco_0313637 [Tanacetum coccineum]